MQQVISKGVDDKGVLFQFLEEKLPEKWRVVSIGEINKATSVAINPLHFPEEVFEYYSIPAFQEYGKPILEKGRQILSNKTLVQEKAILFGKLNPRVLKVWLVESKSESRKIASTEFIPIFAADDAHPEYIYYLCQSSLVVEPAKRLVNGSTPSRQRVDPTSFYKIPIPLPTIAEQRTIAQILRLAQSAVQTRRNELELEREHKAALMKYLFKYGTRCETTKQTEIGEIPESWRVVPLGELLREPLKNGHSARESNTNEGIRTLTLTAVTQNNFSLDNTKLTVAEPNKVRNLWLEPGDIFIERANTREFVGLVALYEGLGNFAIYPDLLIRLRLKESMIPRFAVEFLSTDTCRTYFRKNAIGTAGNMPKIDQGTVSRTLMPFPSKAEQYEIAEISQACNAKIDTLDQEISLLEEVFKTLLEELMTGRLSTLPLIEEEETHE